MKSLNQLWNEWSRDSDINGNYGNSSESPNSEFGTSEPRNFEYKSSGKYQAVTRETNSGLLEGYLFDNKEIYKHGSNYILFDNGDGTDDYLALYYCRYGRGFWSATIHFLIDNHHEKIFQYLKNTMTMLFLNGITRFNIVFEPNIGYLMSEPIEVHRVTYMKLLIDFLKRGKQSTLALLGFDLRDSPGEASIEIIFLLSRNSEWLSKYIDFPEYNGTLKDYLTSADVKAGLAIKLFNGLFLTPQMDELYHEYHMKLLLNKAVTDLSAFKSDIPLYPSDDSELIDY